MSCFAGPYNRGVVTSGLVLYYDINEPVCYSSGRTDIQDLSRNGNTGTLVNGVGYSANNGGSITFDGVDDYLSVTLPGNYSNTTGFSVSFWEYVDSYSGFILNFTFGVPPNVTSFYSFNYSNYRVVDYTFTCNPNAFGTSSGYTQVWTYMTFVADGSNMFVYKNGVLDATGTFLTGGTVTNPTLKFGLQLSGRDMIGKYGTISMYRRALSATEIQQNFNAHRGRFGI